METENQKQQKQRSNRDRLGNRETEPLGVLGRFQTLAKKNLLDQAKHIDCRKDDGNGRHNYRHLAHAPKAEKNQKFPDKAGGSRNCDGKDACRPEEESENRVASSVSAHLVEQAAPGKAFRRTGENKQRRSRKSMSDKQNQNSGQTFVESVKTPATARPKCPIELNAKSFLMSLDRIAIRAP